MFKKLMLAMVVFGIAIWTIPGCGNTDKKSEKTETKTTTEKTTTEKDKKP